MLPKSLYIDHIIMQLSWKSAILVGCYLATCMTRVFRDDNSYSSTVVVDLGGDSASTIWLVSRISIVSSLPLVTVRLDSRPDHSSCPFSLAEPVIGSVCSEVPLVKWAVNSLSQTEELWIVGGTAVGCSAEALG